ncbi:NAD(P)H-quinone oxidoreductase [Bdellovibrio reynosensis]|uniref:NAD(P)H-quinone oxidoreductase n=1 Tax=Bdellovibrio reynosensis TaxID=2835041 RepID=A0ABY4C5G3_9BACT|nr:NAD(P)H-quinone oxidoreductase [Bdellovibrio reynosensis]UOF00123.1 NAD(P)H-quinone oxidoreductase [Bdellovibrio reynosensis]
MLAVEVSSPGGPEVLKIVERPRPEPGPKEVVIEVHAAGVNRPDCAQRQGTYPPPPGASDILGLEVSGRIVAIGKEVKRWKVGDFICALVNGGGYAEYVAVPEGQCLPIPDDMDLVQAAALPETFFTVWTNVFESAGLKNGESILIHGGSGGIGTTAIQLAHAFGAKVFTTVGKEESVAQCKELGANVVIEYKKEDFVTVIKDQTAGKGVDVILDMVGGEYFRRNLTCLSLKGRLVQIATIQGAAVELDLRVMMAKRLTLMGSTLRPRSSEEKTKIADSLLQRVWPLLNDGRLQPVIYKTFPLSQVKEAHELMESSAHTGKIVLLVKK